VGQPGFFDLDKRLEAISAKGDPLEALNFIVPFESFRAGIEAVVRPSAEERKSNAGRKPFDAVMMFKILVLQTLYNLADEQVEYQIRDRLSFMRFLGLGLEDTVPDATTVWLFREALAEAGLVNEPRHGIEWENPQLFSVFVARKTMAPLTYLDCKILA